MADKRFSIVWTPGLTVSLTIQRASDNYYWTGSAWQSGSATVAMTETTGRGEYSEYSSTTSPDAYCLWWAIDENSLLVDRGEYDPYRAASASSSDIAPTLADLKEFLSITDSSDDSFLNNCRTRAGAFVEQYCERRLNSSARTYILDGDGTGEIQLPDYPITAVTSIHVDATKPRDWDDTDDLVDSDNYVIWGGTNTPDEHKHRIVLINAGSFRRGVQNIKVIATTGYSSLPADLYHAAIEVAAEYYNRGHHGRLGLTAKSEGGGSVQYEVTRGLDPGTLIALNLYRRYTL